MGMGKQNISVWRRGQPCNSDNGRSPRRGRQQKLRREKAEACCSGSGMQKGNGQAAEDGR
jgi:hypothetical protein